MQLKSTKLSKAVALLAVTLVVASFVMNNVASAYSITCIIHSPGGTGCQKEPNCPFLEPNQGIAWGEDENCTYVGQENPVTHEVTFRVVKDQLAGNCISVASGCCNNLDTAPHCPAANGCPSPVYNFDFAKHCVPSQ